MLCARTTIAVDLRHDWPTPLCNAGLATTKPTAWLAEGLLTCLTPDEAATLLTQVGALSAAGSRLAFEVDSLGTAPMRAQARQTPAMQQYAHLWKGGLPDASRWLAAHGWDPKVHDRSAVATDYGRPQAVPSAGGFVVATRT